MWYKELREQKERQAKFESEWFEGIWLGHSKNTNEALVGTTQGVVRAYAIIRKNEDERWDGERVKNMKGSPLATRPDQTGSAYTHPGEVRPGQGAGT